MNKHNRTLESFKEAIRLAHKQFIVTGSLKDELSLHKLITESWQFAGKLEHGISMQYWAGFTGVFMQ